MMKLKTRLAKQASLEKQQQQQQEFSAKYDTVESIEQYQKQQQQSKATRDNNINRFRHAYDLLRSYRDQLPIAVFSFDITTTTNNGIQQVTTIGTIKHVQDSVYLVSSIDGYSKECYCIRLNNKNRNNAINHNKAITSFITTDNNKRIQIATTSNKKQLEQTNKHIGKVFNLY